MSVLDGLFGLRRLFVDGVEKPFVQSLEFLSHDGSGLPTSTRTAYDADGKPFEIRSVTLSGGGGGGGGEPGSDLNRAPIRVAAAANLSLVGLPTIQGVAIQPGNSVGAFNQTDGTACGVYVAAAGAWTRRADFDTDADAVAGMGGLIEAGTYARGVWTLLTEGATLGATPLDFKIEPFVDVVGQDGVVLEVAGGVPGLAKVSNAHIVNDTLAVTKLASGGAGNNGKVVGVVGGAMALVDAPGKITPLNERGTALTDRASLQFSWQSVTDDGTRTQIRPHVRIPRCVVRAVSTSNVTISGGTISTTFGGLTVTQVLKTNDSLWIGGQTNPAENGIYRVWKTVTSTAHIVKLSLIDAFFAASGLYVRVLQGNQPDAYRLVIGDASWTSSLALPKASLSNLEWSSVPLDDFALPGDDLSIETGNWAPVEARARQCMHFIGGWLVCDGIYRFTSRINAWNRTGIRGSHAEGWPDNAAPRFIFRGCAGFFIPTWSETYDGVTYDEGIRPRFAMDHILCAFEAGTSDDHYGMLAHGFIHLKGCTFINPYGDGIVLDTQDFVGLNPNVNGSSLLDVLVSGAGLNGFVARGDDSNNISIHRCRSGNHGQRLMGAREYEPVTGHPSASSPALTLNTLMRGNGPAITLTGNRSFGPGACPLLRVEIDSVTAGTGLGQATFRVSYDWDIGTNGAGATWAHSGVPTAATYALSGPATGTTLNFATGPYALTHARNGTIFPGKDWGLVDDAFIGLNVLMSEFSAGTAGGIHSFNSLSTYEKVYQEGGTESDVIGSIYLGGSPWLRTGGDATWLPWIRVGTNNSFYMPALELSGTAVGAGVVSFGVNYMRSISAVSGDVTGYKLRIPSTNERIVEGWSNNDAGQDRFRTLSNHALGTSCQGFLRGVWLGLGHRQHNIDRASLPTKGVPLAAGAVNFTDGAWPVGSLSWEPTPGHAALAYRVHTNSGSAAYNLTWSEVANPSCDMVALVTGDQTRLITDGGHFVMSAGTTAGASLITLGTTGARRGARMRFTVKVQAHNVSLINGGAGGTGAQLTKVLTAGAEYEGDYKFDGTNWIGSVWVCI